MHLPKTLIIGCGFGFFLAGANGDISQQIYANTVSDKSSSEREWRGNYSGQAKPLTAVAKTKEDWQYFWEIAGQSKPSYSFDPFEEIAIGIFIGLRRTGGYSVEIVSLEEREGYFVIEYVEHKPHPGEFVIQSLTTPFLIKIFPRIDLEVIFQEVTVEEDYRGAQ